MKWSVGITSIPERLTNLLPHTITSLKESGFSLQGGINLRLFIDGEFGANPYLHLVPPENITVRYPRIRTYGNWLLGLWELYLRNPESDFFAMFQDDCIASKGLREYLERTLKEESSQYWNLYTFPLNEIKKPSSNHIGWYPSDQLGKGALGLVFDRKGVVDLLSNQHSVARVQNPHRGWRSIDGGIVTALANCGYKEMCHSPSLLQHTGDLSSMGNLPHEKSTSFRGEEFSLLSLLR